MSYIGNSPGVASQRVTTTLTATAAQTQFTTQSGYVLGYVDVYLNGAKLVNGADFEAITGTYITLFAGAASGDVVELVSYVPRGLTDGYTKAEADAKFLDVGGDTASGSLSLASASLTGNLTLSGGTANGLAYLNGSKVLTTGSALTFDGTNLVTTGSVSTTKIVVSGATDSTNIALSGYVGGAFLNTPSGTSGYLAVNGTASYAWSAAQSIWYTSGSEGMRLTSTGLGIGTTVPWAKLSIAASNGQFGIANGNTAGGMKLQAWTAAGNGDGYLAFEGYTKEYARITSSGNFAIGTTTADLRLEVDGGVSTTFTNCPVNVNLVNRGTIAAGLGAGIAFSANYNNTIFTTYATISGIRENATSGNPAGALVFGVRDAGGGVGIERARITSTGTLLVGTTSGSGINGRAVFASSQSYTNSGDQSGQVHLVNTNSTDNNRSSLQFYNSSAGVVAGIDSVNRSHTAQTGDLQFWTVENGNLRDTMRMTNGNVGIGTNSPVNRLTVNGGAFSVTRGSNGTSASFVSGDGTNDTTFAIGHNASGITLTNSNPHTGAYNNLIFANTTVGETMRIAANGNVGIGNSNPQAKLHIEGNSLTLNTENSAQEKTLYFRYSNGANVQSDSYLVFKTGGSPQERMRIDADGNWKLGTTGFSTRATIAGTNTNVNTTVNNTPGLLFLYDTSAAANAGPEIVMGCSYDGNNSIAGTSIKSYKVPGAGSNSDQFHHGLIFKTSNYPTGIREVARIDHNGRLCIGYSGTWNDSAPYLQVRDGIVIGSTASSALFTSIKSPNGYDLTLTANANPANLGVNANIIFRSGNSGGGGPSELMRISSTGNLLIGTTIESGSTGSVGMRAGSAGQLILLADNSSLFHQAVGNYYLVTTAGGSTSDATLKTNVQQLSGALAKICAIRGVNFEFVDTQKCTSDNGTQIGVIAQEVEPHYPEIVLTDSSGKKTVRYDRLVAPLIEAIKEQQALIQQLQQDVAQLKGATQ